jgi:hypothetical protein
MLKIALFLRSSSQLISPDILWWGGKKVGKKGGEDEGSGKKVGSFSAIYSGFRFGQNWVLG